jgi:hypothetical protein
VARATDADVRALVEIPADVSTAPFITSASALVTLLLASSGLSEAILTQIEIFLAAHYAVLVVENGGLRRQTVGQSTDVYADINNKLIGLLSTRFGQQAIAFDSTGILQDAATGKAKAQFRVVGGPVS